MRILLLTTSFPLRPGASNGVFVERLAQHLGRKCHLQVLTPASQEPLILTDDKLYKLSTFSYAPAKWRILAQGSGGVPAALSVHPWAWGWIPVFVTSMMIACFQLARRADLIFANWSICGVVAGFVGRLSGRPVVVTLRGSDANRVDSSLLHRLLVGLCLRWCDRVVTVSDDITNRMRSVFPSMAEKLVMIPNGVEVHHYDVRGDEDDNGTVRLLIVGNLVSGKSVQTAIHALSLLPSVFVLDIVGDGPEREALIKLAADLGVGGRVNFAGQVPPEDVRAWLAQADVLVMTSLSEGRPNAVLEAMAAGLPIVGSDIPGIRELVFPDVNGMLFLAGESDALVDALLPLQNPRLRLRLGSAARQSIEERGLTWENAATRYMHVFEQVLSEAKS